MKTVFRAAVLVALLTAVSIATAQTDDPALDQLAADFSAAWAAGDAKALAELYTENALRVTSNGGSVIGRAAIENDLAGALSGPLKGTTFTPFVGQLEMLGTDIAVNEGTYEISGFRTPDGEVARPFVGRYLNTLVKRNGKWMIASNAAIPPPESGQ